MQGHGEYTEIYNEKEFFEISKKSENIICLFYKDDSQRCKIVDYHFKILAKKHIEARFCKLNVERCPFLTGIIKVHFKNITIYLLPYNNTFKHYRTFTD